MSLYIQQPCHNINIYYYYYYFRCVKRYSECLNFDAIIEPFDLIDSPNIILLIFHRR